MDTSKSKICVSCGESLINKRGLWLCSQCNTEDLEKIYPFLTMEDNDKYVFIECPGATHFEPGTTTVTSGVDFIDDDDPFKGYRIVDKPVYSPTHCKKRRILIEALGNIRRCQGCQDYTVRMRRPEGADFCIPSPKHPHRKQLKSVNSRSFA